MSNNRTRRSPKTWIEHLNQRHAVVPVGGRVVILDETYDPVLGRRNLGMLNKTSFELLYCNETLPRKSTCGAMVSPFSAGV